jgi:hypothetical protein
MEWQVSSPVLERKRNEDSSFEFPPFEDNNIVESACEKIGKPPSAIADL